MALDAGCGPCAMFLARLGGVRWAEVAEACGLSPADARDRFAAWVDEQQLAHDAGAGGMSDDEAAEAWLLLED
jgi:hypothetical protein